MVSAWSSGTQIQRMTNLEVVAKSFVDDQLETLKRSWKDI